MRTPLPLLAALVCLGAMGATAAPWQPSFQDEEPTDVVGVPAPELQARTWYNHIGQTPTLASLSGKVWVVEMWATW
ncbi:MAG: hypothetical protein H6830_07510 [Planctomycetes bacterium]|nr:hypothetical protein [Planctomycetota bacterium]MCB9910245.1 hypothetical protein [Planctomycetota bacterium]HPF15266.1 hypothetical protein [Planctomycetota bacterium]